MEILFLFIFILVERFFAIRYQSFFSGENWVNIVWYLFFQNILLGFAVYKFLDAALVNVKLNLFGEWPILLQIIFFILLIDFASYWIHRLAHNWQFLWRFHQVHHSSKNVNSLSTFRQHGVESIIGHVLQFGIVVGVGAHEAVFPSLLIFQFLIAVFSHSNIKVRLGFLAYIINTPEMHQWHHSSEKITHFKNFANQLAIWDWMFGTAYNPKEFPQEAGLEYEFPENYFLQQFYVISPFDVKKWEKHPIFKSLTNTRRSIFQKIKSIFVRN